MEYYDEIAESYEELHRAEQLKKLKVIAENLDLKPSDRVLDVGCGAGFSAEVIKANIVGIDPAERLLAKAPFPTFKGVAEMLPFPDDSFDMVISVTAIHNFNNVKKGLEEMRRVGKGRFAFSILRKASNFGEIDSLIRELFNVDKVIEEDKDTIYFCTKTY